MNYNKCPKCKSTKLAVCRIDDDEDIIESPEFEIRCTSCEYKWSQDRSPFSLVED